MIRINEDDITEEEFEKIIFPFEENIYSYIREKVINDFVAFYVAEGYKCSALWNENFDYIINSACEHLTNLSSKDCNKAIIKELLEREHRLKILNEMKLEIAEI